MVKRGIAVLFAAILFGACSKPASQPASTTDPRVETMLKSFAAAIASKDYASAHAAVATEMRGSITQQDLRETFGDYREAFPGPLKTKVSVDPYDKETDSLLPDTLHGRVVAEGVLEFDAGDEEGFVATVWVLMDAGEPKIGHFYVED